MKIATNWMVFLVFCSMGTGVYAKDKNLRELQLSVTYGDKQSKFSVQEINGGALVEFHSNYNEHRKVLIKPEDLKYILEKAAALDGGSDKKSDCPREFLSISSTGIGGKNLKSLVCFTGRQPNLKTTIK